MSDWQKPKLVRWRSAEGKSQKAIGGTIALEDRTRHLYLLDSKKEPLIRHGFKGPIITPLDTEASKAQLPAPRLGVGWKIGFGLATAGFDVAPDGTIAYLNRPKAGKVKPGDICFIQAGKSEPSCSIKGVMGKYAGCFAFDRQGHLYVGRADKKHTDIPKGFQGDRNYATFTGKIFKYAPTGSLESGNLYPTAPKAPEKVYPVQFGDLGGSFFRRPSSFAVDGFGRILYPNSLASYVALMDNNGNEILRFGTYGNRDSMGGLEGDRVPTKGIPMIYPKSVDASDDYIYVGDPVNCRMLRIKKTYALVGSN